MRRLFFFLVFAACQTPVNDPGRARSERKNIIGLTTGSSDSSPTASLSFCKNIDKSLSLRTSLAHDWKPRSISLDLSSGHDLMGDELNPDSTRTFRERSSSIHFGLNYFPWRSQFLFTGARATIGQYQTSFLENSRDFSISERKENVEFLDNYVQIATPIGLSVDMVEDKFNLFASINPAWQVRNRRSFLSLSKQNLDAGRLSQSLDAIDRNRQFRIYFESGLGKAF